MEQQTQAQIDAWIQFIDSAEEPATVTNVIVAAVFKYLMDKIKGIEDLNIDSRITQVVNNLNTLVDGNASEAIESFNEVIAFLDGVNDDETLTGLLLELRDSIDSKAGKAGDGRLAAGQAPVVMLDSMGTTLDSVGSDTTVKHIAQQGEYIYGAGVIKYYKTYNGTGSQNNEVISLGPPQQGLIYCNKVTGLQYRWAGYDTGWLRVGGSDIEVVDNLTEGGSTKPLSAEMGKQLDETKPTIGDTSEADFEVADDDGFVILQIIDGHIVTGNFNSDQLVQLFQQKLESGTNIKTINGESLLGPGNITITEGSGGAAIVAGTSIPKMNGVAAAGTSDNYAREDHIHPKDTRKQDTILDLATIRSNSLKGLGAVDSQQDGIIVLTLANGDTYTINLNHAHSQYLKFVLCRSESEYEALAVKDNSTLYLIPESDE